MKICGKCGFVVADENEYCSRCGSGNLRYKPDQPQQAQRPQPMSNGGMRQNPGQPGQGGYGVQPGQGGYGGKPVNRPMQPQPQPVRTQPMPGQPGRPQPMPGQQRQPAYPQNPQNQGYQPRPNMAQQPGNPQPGGQHRPMPNGYQQNGQPVRRPQLAPQQNNEYGTDQFIGEDQFNIDDDNGFEDAAVGKKRGNKKVKPPKQPKQPKQPKPPKQSQQAQQNGYAEGGGMGYGDAEMAPVMSVKDWVLFFIKMIIPIYNIIVVVKALTGSYNPNLTSYVKTMLIMTAITLLITILMSAVIGGALLSVFS